MTVALGAVAGAFVALLCVCAWLLVRLWNLEDTCARQAHALAEERIRHRQCRLELTDAIVDLRELRELGRAARGVS